uniref:Uncharacterized protein n=1 Tax=Megaselia scalaris TaxID=36166 RepID=T1H371_MEGSC
MITNKSTQKLGYANDIDVVGRTRDWKKKLESNDFENNKNHSINSYDVFVIRWRIPNTSS